MFPSSAAPFFPSQTWYSQDPVLQFLSLPSQGWPSQLADGADDLDYIGIARAADELTASQYFVDPLPPAPNSELQVDMNEIDDSVDFPTNVSWNTSIAAFASRNVYEKRIRHFFTFTGDMKTC